MKRINYIIKLMIVTLSFGLLSSCSNDNKLKITSPQNNETGLTITPRITWTEVKGVKNYYVSISKDQTFENVIEENYSNTYFYGVATPLEYASQYYVRVGAVKKTTKGSIELSQIDTISFVTSDKHNLDNPDFNQSRMIHDFENFDNTNELKEWFTPHTGGDDVSPELINYEIEGVTSKAMQINYKKGTAGWSALMSTNAPEKKVWTGAKGIRLFVKGAGNGSSLTLRIGKRGYQVWSANVVCNNSQGQYISIPFSSFEDSGGGDGLWDLTGIVRLWFYVKSATDTSFVIDNISIGSTDDYTTDTRYLLSEKLSINSRPIDDFEDGTISTWVKSKNASLEIIEGNEVLSGKKSLKMIMPDSNQNLSINLGYYNFADAKYLSMKTKLSTTSFGEIKFSFRYSNGTAFSYTKGFSTGEGIDRLTVDLTKLINKEGIQLDLSKITTLVFMPKYTGNIILDDITFTKTYTNESKNLIPDCVNTDLANSLGEMQQLYSVGGDRIKDYSKVNKSITYFTKDGNTTTKFQSKTYNGDAQLNIATCYMLRFSVEAKTISGKLNITILNNSGALLTFPVCELKVGKNDFELPLDFSGQSKNRLVKNLVLTFETETSGEFVIYNMQFIGD